VNPSLQPPIGPSTKVPTTGRGGKTGLTISKAIHGADDPASLTGSMSPKEDPLLPSLAIIEIGGRRFSAGSETS
jgi:hypothetical protein